MKRVKFPEKINRTVLYEQIIPDIYNSIINNEYDFSFDMRNTQLADAESLITILSISSIIRNKYKHIPKLELPEHIPILKYLERNNFFSISKIKGNQVLDFEKFTTFSDNIKFKSTRYKSKIININYNSTILTHQSNVSRLTYNLIQESLNDRSHPEKWEYYTLFELSFIQLIQNFFEHNLYDNTYECTAYYIGQLLPYGKIQVVFYDTGKGLRKRILEMIENDNQRIINGQKSDPDIDKYRKVEKSLRNKKLLIEESSLNSNFIAIQAALNYRSGSLIPGLSVIRDFTLLNKGTFLIHSGNAQYKCQPDGSENFKIYNFNFSGLHISLEFPVKF